MHTISIPKPSHKPNPRYNKLAGFHSFPGTYGSFEVFWEEDQINSTPGWYWWACFPGCLPDGDASGPFTSSRAAWLDARDGG